MNNPILESILLSLFPISELRGAIPYGVYRGLSIFSAFFICIIANICIIPLSFFFLDHIHAFFMNNILYKN